MKKTIIAALALLTVNSAFAATSLGSSATNTTAPSAATTTATAGSASSSPAPAKKKAKSAEYTDFCGPTNYVPLFADCTPKSTARKFFTTLKKALMTNDKETVSHMVSYPLNVGRSSLTVHNPSEFVSNYDEIFTEEVIQSIVSEKDLSNAFSNTQGVAIGDIWFSAETMTSPGNFDNSGPALIIAVNN